MSPIAFGAFKIGRNTSTKYPAPYDLPDPPAAARLLNAVLDMGINIIDTAPAYGLSEERIGQAIAHRRDEFILCTKVGETFANNQSTFDFTGPAVRDSIHQSLRRLRTEVIDVVHVHSSGDDLHIMNQTDCIATLQSLRDQGAIRCIGLSAKTVAGAMAALSWADTLMLEYHLHDRSQEVTMAAAAARGAAVFIKKGLASGTLAPGEAIPFILDNPAVTSLVVGSLSIDHLNEALRLARDARSSPRH